MTYQFKSKLTDYTRNYKTLKRALKEFDSLDDKDNPDDFGIIYGIKPGDKEPTMRYLVEEGVWILL